MKRMVFGESVQGASHKRVDKECQDSFKKLEYDDGTVIMAIADGHGSKACPYSKSGSSIAVNVFCKVMDEFHASYAENLEMLLRLTASTIHASSGSLALAYSSRKRISTPCRPTVSS